MRTPLKELMKICNAQIGDSIFLACGKENEIEKILSASRDKIANDLNIIKKINFLFVGSLIIQCTNTMKSLKKLYLVTILFLCLKEI